MLAARRFTSNSAAAAPGRRRNSCEQDARLVSVADCGAVAYARLVEEAAVAAAAGVAEERWHIPRAFDAFRDSAMMRLWIVGIATYFKLFFLLQKVRGDDRLRENDAKAARADARDDGSRDSKDDGASRRGSDYTPNPKGSRLDSSQDVQESAAFGASGSALGSPPPQSPLSAVSGTFPGVAASPRRPSMMDARTALQASGKQQPTLEELEALLPFLERAEARAHVDVSRVYCQIVLSCSNSQSTISDRQFFSCVYRFTFRCLAVLAPHVSPHDLDAELARLSATLEAKSDAAAKKKKFDAADSDAGAAKTDDASVQEQALAERAGGRAFGVLGRADSGRADARGADGKGEARRVAQHAEENMRLAQCFYASACLRYMKRKAELAGRRHERLARKSAHLDVTARTPLVENALQSMRDGALTETVEDLLSACPGLKALFERDDFVVPTANVGTPLRGKTRVVAPPQRASVGIGAASQGALDKAPPTRRRLTDASARMPRRSSAGTHGSASLSLDQQLHEVLLRRAAAHATAPEAKRPPSASSVQFPYRAASSGHGSVGRVGSAGRGLGRHVGE